MSSSLSLSPLSLLQQGHKAPAPATTGGGGRRFLPPQHGRQRRRPDAALSNPRATNSRSVALELLFSERHSALQAHIPLLLLSACLPASLPPAHTPLLQSGSLSPLCRFPAQASERAYSRSPPAPLRPSHRCPRPPPPKKRGGGVLRGARRREEENGRSGGCAVGTTRARRPARRSSTQAQLLLRAGAAEALPQLLRSRDSDSSPRLQRLLTLAILRSRAFK